MKKPVYLGVLAPLLALVFWQCSAIAIRYQFSDQPQAEKKAPAKWELFNRDGLLIEMEPLGAHELLAETDLGINRKKRLPEYFYVRYRVSNQSGQQVQLNFFDSAFVGAGRSHRPVSRQEYEEIHTSPVYADFDDLHAFYLQSGGQKPGQKLPGGQSIEISDQSSGWQVVAYQLLLPGQYSLELALPGQKSVKKDFYYHLLRSGL